MADTQNVISVLMEAISRLKEINDADLIEFSVAHIGPGEREVCIRFQFENSCSMDELGEQ